MDDFSNAPGHWTEAQLIASLYETGPENSHLDGCAECRERLSVLQANRRMLEHISDGGGDEISPAFLNAQRRNIYVRLAEPSSFGLTVRRWAQTAATLLVLGSGLMLFEQRQRERPEDKISDVQLAQELSSVSQDLEMQQVAPLQGLFE